jgi:hypothetical protein
MSYCAFENTGLALDQLIDMVGEALDEGEALDFSSREEEYAFRSIRHRMRDLLEMLGEYDEMFPVKATEDTDDV